MENQTNKNIKAVVVSIIVAVIAVAAILLGTNISSQASKNDKGNRFVTGKHISGSKLTLTDNKIAKDLRPDRKFDKNDWEAQNWHVYINGYTKEAYFTVQTFKQFRSWQRDASYDIEGIYHRFVENGQDCKIPKGKTQNIPNYFESIWDYPVAPYLGHRKDEKVSYASTNYMSTKDRPDGTNGSCVLIKVRDRDQTIYATYYGRYSK